MPNLKELHIKVLEQHAQTGCPSLKYLKDGESPISDLNSTRLRGKPTRGDKYLITCLGNRSAACLACIILTHGFGVAEVTDLT
jgi:hypothetical protein